MSGLFEQRVCFVTPAENTPGAALLLLENFWRALGAKVVVAAPAKHDEIVAHISHLPQAVATSLACTLGNQDGDWRHLAGNGLRDTTRIAAGDATMWVEIFQQNRDAVLQALTRQEEEFSAFRLALERSDWAAIRARLERGKAWRDGFRT